MDITKISGEERMNVKIKGINDYLYFELNEQVQFNCILEDLKSILDSLPKTTHGYFPKAFFDLKSRILSNKEMCCLIDMLYGSQKVLFGGIKEQLEGRTMKLVEKDIYNGEIVEANNQDLLVIGNVHVGAIVRGNKNIYIIGKVEGAVEALAKESTINLSSANHARISIFNRLWQDVTIFTLSLFYYKNDQIHMLDQQYINKNSRG